MTQTKKSQPNTTASATMQNLSSTTTHKLAKATHKLAKTTRNLSSAIASKTAQKISQKIAQKVAKKITHKIVQKMAQKIFCVGQNLSSVAIQNLVGVRFRIVGICGVFLCFFSLATLESKSSQDSKASQESKTLQESKTSQKSTATQKSATTQESKTSQEAQNIESNATKEQNLAIDFVDGIKKFYEEYAIELGIKGECKNDASSPTKPNNSAKTSTPAKQNTPAKQGAKDKIYKASFTCKYPQIYPFSRFGLREMKDFFVIADMQTRVSVLNQNEIKDSTNAKIIYTKDLATKLSKVQRFLPKNFTSNSYQKIANEDFEVGGEAVIDTNDGLKWRVGMDYVISSPYFKQKSLAEILWIINDFNLDSIDDEKDGQCKEALREIHTQKSIFEAKITDLPKNIQAQCKRFMENLDFMQSAKIHIKEVKILLDAKSVRNIIYEMMADDYQKNGEKLTQQEFVKQVKQANESMQSSISLLRLTGSEADEKFFMDFLLTLADKVTNAITQNKNAMIGFSIKHKQGQTIDIGKWLKADDKSTLEYLIWQSLGDMQWQVIDK